MEAIVTKGAFGILAIIDIVNYTPQMVQIDQETSKEIRLTFYSKVKKLIVKYGMEYITDQGDAVVVFGSSPESFLKFVKDIFVDEMIPAHERFNYIFRVVAHSAWFDFLIDSEVRKIVDPHGDECIKVFRLEKKANQDQLLVTEPLFYPLKKYVNDFGFTFKLEYGIIKPDESEPVKGREELGKIVLYRLYPPMNNANPNNMLPGWYKNRRDELLDFCSTIPVFGNLYDPIRMEDDFIKLTLEMDGGRDYTKIHDYDRLALTDKLYEEMDRLKLRKNYNMFSADKLLEGFNKGFIIGLPGSGKTTILKHLAYKVLKDNTNTKNILFVNCRDLQAEYLQTSNNYTVEFILLNLARFFLYPQHKGEFWTDMELTITNTVRALKIAWYNKSMLILIDALDESPTDSIKMTIVQYCKELMRNIKDAELVEDGSNKDNKCFITSRSSEGLVATFDKSYAPIFKVNPMSKEQMRDMAKILYKDDKILYDEFYDNSWRYSYIQKIAGTPLTALLLIFYYKIYRKFEGRFLTYDLLIKFVLMHVWERIKKQDITRSNTEMKFLLDQLKKDEYSENEYEVYFQYKLLAAFAFELMYGAHSGKAEKTFTKEELTNFIC
ncbi:MAG: NACHT domain-containing protein, partial [Candidatus Magnetoovum sp. WYHC-5]|nr:NACHT domain-containing protein [Candidatus Magnetoovum sp. WYHC-5]